MMNPATTSEYVTIAVPFVVAGVRKLDTIPSIDTCNDATLDTNRIWDIPIMIIGNHDACGSMSAANPALGCVDMRLFSVVPYVFGLMRAALTAKISELPV